jgi:signal transduction histidine kinase
LVGEVVRRLRGSLPSGIDMEVIAGAGLWPVLLDQEALGEALAELMTNASEAMNGMGRVSVETGNMRVGRAFAARYPGLAAGEYVRITVKDRGPGMSADMAERALNPFFTSKGGEGHLGLGLSAVYGFTNQSGGTLVIHGGNGEGATVELYFPRTEEEAAPFDQETGRQRDGQSQPQRRAGGKER